MVRGKHKKKKKRREQAAAKTAGKSPSTESAPPAESAPKSRSAPKSGSARAPGKKKRAPRAEPASAPAAGRASTGTPTTPAGATKTWLPLAAWLALLALIALFYLALKMFAMHPFLGDENIYFYQSKLISEGVPPYSGFSMAHPPLQTLFAGLLLKLFGFNLVLGRSLPILFCLAGGILLAVMVRRELGAVASICTAALYLLAYEPLRASSHFTGVNMTVALLILAVFAFRLGAIRLAAAVCVAAVFTRLYAIPGVMVLVVFALLADRNQALRLILWGGGLGIAAFVAAGIWTGFGDMVGNTMLYHAQKTPMKPGELARMRDTVWFHNNVIVALFALAQIALAAVISLRFQQTPRKQPLARRLRTAIEQTHTGLLILCSAIALFFLLILLNLDRVWMYYFIPSFPFAAVVAGWLLSTWLHAALRLLRSRLANRPHGLPKELLAGSLVLLALFLLNLALAPNLEARLGYYQRQMQRPAAERVHRYDFKPGLLPASVNSLVRSTLWLDERTIGNRYHRFNFFLWHESRTLDVVDEVVATIKAETAPDDEIFGDSTTVPLFALLSGRRIAANAVDTNVQRFRSGAVDADALIETIDVPRTRMIIFRHRFGVGGIDAFQKLVRRNYRRLESVTTSDNKTYHLFKRRAGI
jgi:hypothetical protein